MTMDEGGLAGAGMTSSGNTLLLWIGCWFLNELPGWLLKDKRLCGRVGCQ